MISALMAKTSGPQLTVANRREWRAWLKEHHALEPEVWLVFFKKHTGNVGVSYSDAREEAICFGWINGLKKRLDDDRYVHRFSPRKSRSRWSPRNLELARKMIAAGKMTRPGRKALEDGTTYDRAVLDAIADKSPALAPAMEKAIRSNERAWQNFSNLPPGYRKQYVAWLNNAKRQETRERRLEEAIRLLEKNEKLGMK